MHEVKLHIYDNVVQRENRIINHKIKLRNKKDKNDSCVKQ